MRRLCVLLICCLFGFVACTRAQPPLVVILLPGTSLEEWQASNAPSLHRLMKTGALAVMNTRTARPPSDRVRETPASAALTLGAGARAVGDPESLGFLPVRTAGPLYTRRVGQSPLSDQYVDPTWPTLLSANKGLGYQIRLGNLADALATRKVVFLSGGGMFADSVATTSAGAVVRVDHLTTADDQCLIWDAGPDLIYADTVIAHAATQISRKKGRLIVLSPFAGNQDYSHGRRLTPVLEWGEGVSSGLLYSPSTHRLGLVTNTDFAPTLAAYFGLTREDFPTRPFGDVWTVVPAVNPEQKLFLLQSQAEAQGMKLRPYLAIALGGWMLFGTALLFVKRLPQVLAVLPLVLLTSALFSHTLLLFSAWCAAIFLLASVVSQRLGMTYVSAILSAFIATALIFDMLTGSRLMQCNILGYSAIEGARYYGIGNEAMGILIGALIVLAARLWSSRIAIRWLILLGLAVISLLLGSSSAGAKAGGLIVALIAFGTLGFSLFEKRWSLRATLTLTLGILVIIGCAAIGDAYWQHGAHSHIGEAVRRIQTGGLSEAGDIVTRKLTVETRLLYHNAWAFPLWGGMICLGLLWHREKSPTFVDRAVRHAGIAAVAACVLLNDAGVVAGALCLVPLWCDSVAAQQTKRPLQRQKSAARAT